MKKSKTLMQRLGIGVISLGIIGCGPQDYQDIESEEDALYGESPELEEVFYEPDPTQTGQPAPTAPSPYNPIPPTAPAQTTPPSTNTVPTEPAPGPIPPIPENIEIKIDANNGSLKRSMARSNATGRYSLLTYNEEQSDYSINIPKTTNYNLVVRYSNDDISPIDIVSILIDDEKVGDFLADDTGNYGYGWNVFTKTAVIPLGTIEQGSKKLSARIDRADRYGIELDLFTITNESEE